MAPFQRLLCLPRPKRARATPDKRLPSQTSRSKPKVSKASPKFKSKCSVQRSKSSSPKKTVQRTAAHKGPSEPGVSLAGLKNGGPSENEPKTLVSGGEDEAGDEVDVAEEEEERSRPRGIIGIDVGTTFSAISFVMTDQAYTEIKVNKKWPGAQSHGALEKVETSYANPETPGQNPHLKQVVWGYSVAQESEKLHCAMLVFSWFKLLMGVDDDLTGKEINDPSLKETVGKYTLKGVGYEKILGDWYKILYAKALEMIRELFTRDFVENMDITWVISHPANYNEGQRGTTMKAAQDAHKQELADRARDKFCMVTEPEAAATITIAESLELEKDSSPFKKGSTTMTIDLGGGTIDAKSYVVVRTVPLRLRDACTGSAGWIGATSIYRAFVAKCEVEFGAVFTSLPPAKSGPGSGLCRAFEERMKGFTGKDDDEVFKIPLVAMMQRFKDSGCESKKYDTIEGVITITNQDMCKLFEGVIGGMMEIVEEQCVKLALCNAPPLTAIAGVGGLINCDYVLDKLIERCTVLFRGSALVRRPHAPWSAVVRGNALFGLKPFLVEHRKSRHCLGVEVARTFDPTKDDINDAFDDPKLGKRVGGYVQWLIQKGQRVKHEKEIARFPASVCLQGGERSATLKVKLYSYGGDDVPEKITYQDVRNVGELSFTCNRLEKDQATQHLLAAPAICNVNVRARLAKDTGLVKFLVYKTGRDEILGTGVLDYCTTSAD